MTYILHPPMKDTKIELESFLPRYTEESNEETDQIGNKKSQNDGGFPQTTEGRSPGSVIRTKVKFQTGLNWFAVDTQKEAVYVFDRDFSVREAANYAIANYPVLSRDPDFTNFGVFFSRNVSITDLDVNVHSMFGPDDTMYITDDPFFYEIEGRRTLRGIMIFVACLFLFVFGSVWLLLHFMEREAITYE